MTPVFVGLENEPMVEDEHVQVTKMRLGERTSGVAVQVKAIGSRGVHSIGFEDYKSVETKLVGAFVERADHVFRVRE